jgi:hypothetical protein
VCAPLGANICDACLTSACCAQLQACEMDPVCTEAQSCFDKCYAAGQGVACLVKCYNAFPSVAGKNLIGCGLSTCVSSCQ